MRYYDIKITNPDTGEIVKIGDTVMQFSSYDEKQKLTKPGALNVEFDIPVVTADIPAGDSHVKIWGIGLNVVNNASVLNFMDIEIRAGMQKGLPLATKQTIQQPSRNGLLYRGTIKQAYGNWQGLEQTLELFVTVLLHEPHMTVDMKRDAPMSDAIMAAFTNAGLKSSVSIDPRLVTSSNIPFIHGNMSEFAKQIYDTSKIIIPDANYLGVKIIKSDDKYICTDNYVPTITQSTIQWYDMIGQPAWLDFNMIQVKCVMRSDLKVGDTITLGDESGELLITNRPKGQAQWKFTTRFKGKVFVNRLRHVGNYRMANADGWITIADVFPV